MDYHGGMVTRLNQSDFVKTALRLPPDLHAMLHQAAEASGRSYNAEIVARLQASFEPRAPIPVTSSRKDDATTPSAPPTAEDIAELVAEKLSGSMVQPISLEALRGKYLSPGISNHEDFYRRFAKLLALVEDDSNFNRHEPQVEKRGNTPYGPAASANARKRPPKTT